MELRLYSKMLLRSWWLVALATLAAVNVALIQIYRATPVYETSARFIVSPETSGLEDVSDFIYSLDTLSRKSIITTYAETLQSRQIFQSTLTEMSIEPSLVEGYETSAVVVPDSNLLELFVRGNDPAMVALLANSIGVQTIDYMAETYTAYKMRVIDPAVAPDGPSSPNPKRIVAVALMMGMVVGAALAVVREQLRVPLEALLQHGMIDSVSWAYKRSFFERRLRQEIAQNTTGRISIGLVHLEGLHEVIEQLPRPVLQRTLRHVTRTLQNQLRGSDVFGRWSDVGFAVLLPETTGSAAVRTLERIRQTLEKPLELAPGGEKLLLNPRIGGVSYTEQEPYKILIERLEMATEQSRQNGVKTVFLPTKEAPSASLMNKTKGRETNH